MVKSMQERGFTLVELMVAMTIGLVILAGIVSLYVSGVNSNRAEISRTERMSDLYLASQIMQSELKTAQDICWDAGNKQLIYQPLDSTAALNGCNNVAASNGAFRLDANTRRICWDRPDEADGCQELIRDMDKTTGLVASLSGGVWDIRLKSTYTDKDHTTKSLELDFKLWPRN